MGTERNEDYEVLMNDIDRALRKIEEKFSEAVVDVHIDDNRLIFVQADGSTIVVSLPQR